MAQRVYEPADAAEAAAETYRPLHPFAIPSLALAAGGLIAIWWPLAAIVSIFALVLATVAFVQIVRRPEDLSGKLWAGLAIAVAAFTIGLAPVRSAVEQNYLFGAARKAGDQWLQLLAEDRLYEAHQLTLPATDRQPAEADLEAFYSAPLSAEERAKQEAAALEGPVEPRDIIARYAKDELIAPMLATDELSWTFRGRRKYVEDAMENARYLDLAYDLRFGDGDPAQADVVPVILHLERKEIPEQRIATWRVLTIKKQVD
jgi:hypothetical protein